MGDDEYEQCRDGRYCLMKIDKEDLAWRISWME
jgi:hypothetical protein